jgi:hypothetical protein
LGLFRHFEESSCFRPQEDWILDMCLHWNQSRCFFTLCKSFSNWKPTFKIKQFGLLLITQILSCRLKDKNWTPVMCMIPPYQNEQFCLRVELLTIIRETYSCSQVGTKYFTGPLLRFVYRVHANHDLVL